MSSVMVSHGKNSDPTPASTFCTGPRHTSSARLANALNTPDTAPSARIEAAYAHCLRLAREHYENFPVASLLLPRVLRREVASIYAFARHADDIADEGTIESAVRLQRLDAWESQLDAALAGNADDPVLLAVAHTIHRRNLPTEPLRALLRAFRFDVRNEGFATPEELLAYCRCSANPVGRIVLHLWGLATEDRLELSDAVCTGLQLTNFWQDVSLDVPRGRVNVPRSVLRAHGWSVERLARDVADEHFRQMMAELVAGAARHLAIGRGLLQRLPDRRLRIEIAATIGGAEWILNRIVEADFDVLRIRPTLSRFRGALVGLRAIAAAVGDDREPPAITVR